MKRLKILYLLPTVFSQFNTNISYPPPLMHPNLIGANLLRRFQHMKGMVAFLQTGNNEDGDARVNFRQKIQDYGCFCYPGNSQQPRYSPGSPVDEIDNTCRRLHRRWHRRLTKFSQNFKKYVTLKKH